MGKELVEQKNKPFSTELTETLMEMANVLPIDFNVPRFVQNSVALLNDNAQLAEFAKKNGVKQIKLGLLKGAVLGLDAMNKECYLIPYGNTLNFMIDYRGNIKLAKKFCKRKITDIYAKLVRDGDDFEEIIVDGKPSINYKPMPFNNNKIIGAFAVCVYEDGGLLYDTMSLADLENTRKSSKVPNAPAWTKFTGEMYKKTVLHRLCKMIDLEFDTPEQSKLFTEDVEVDNTCRDDANTVEFIVEEEPIPTIEQKTEVTEQADVIEDWQKES